MFKNNIAARHCLREIDWSFASHANKCHLALILSVSSIYYGVGNAVSSAGGCLHHGIVNGKAGDVTHIFKCFI